MRFTLLLLFATTVLFSCKNEAKKTIDAVENVVNTKKYTLSPFSSSPTFPGATLSDMAYESGKFSFGVSGGGYELGSQTSDAPQKMCANSGKGQHIHLIVDNKPYSAQYVSEFEYDIEDGEHTILAFLSRSYHESIKASGASIVKKVIIKDKSITSSTDVAGPMLFYSRPKGTYTGEDTKKVMLDFFLKDVTLSSAGYKVKADINGEEHTIDKWQPYYIEGLPMGENNITLTLLDKDGNKADVALNPVKRTFMMVAEPVAN